MATLGMVQLYTSAGGNTTEHSTSGLASVLELETDVLATCEAQNVSIMLTSCLLPPARASPDIQMASTKTHWIAPCRHGWAGVMFVASRSMPQPAPKPAKTEFARRL